jgi:hypothetical protein
MAYDVTSETRGGPERGRRPGPADERMADLKIFWGPDICRLDYLIHLVDTGRIKEEGVERIPQHV